MFIMLKSFLDCLRSFNFGVHLKVGIFGRKFFKPTLHGPFSYTIRSPHMVDFPAVSTAHWRCLELKVNIVRNSSFDVLQ